MKFTIFYIILLSILFTACGHVSQEDSFREQIDNIKMDDIPNIDKTVSTYSVDSSTHWNVISQITQRQKLGNKTTLINTEFKQNDKLVKAFSNDLNQKNHFQGQIITTDLADKISLCYLLTDEHNKNSLFKISCESDGKSFVEKIDSVTSKEWTKIKLTILKKS